MTYRPRGRRKCSRSVWSDELHSAEEPRFKSIGYSDLGRILVVVTSDDGIQPRIISAWRVSKRERDAYQRRR
jgi:uncharacterized DUF497 family protein